jgi:peptidoglycan hydrolase-like protein with peptidoglycan-binding domain
MKRNTKHTNFQENSTMTIATSIAQAYPTLRQGSTGENVKQLQNLLNYVYGPNLKVDGIFGSQTEAAVKKFQKDYGLTVDGIVGVTTWNRLYSIRYAPVTTLPTLRRGSQGKDVKYLQDLLEDLGYSVVVDGIFGAKTETAVKKFQKDRGLVTDGIVGSQTWDALHENFQGVC